MPDQGFEQRDTEPSRPRAVAGIDTPVQFLKGVGQERALLLEKLGIKTVADLLYFAPRRHIDLRHVTPISQLKPNQVQAIEARIEYAHERTTRAGVHVLESAFSDGTGFVTVMWFHRSDLPEKLVLDKTYRLTGKVKREENRWKMTNPQLNDQPDKLGPGSLVPVYSLTEGISAEQMRSFVRQALQSADLLPDLLPPHALEVRKWPNIATAIRNLHFPKTYPDYKLAYKRLAYDEFVTLQMALAVKRAQSVGKPGVVIPIDDEVDRRIRKLFPFALTGAQDRTINEISADLRSPAPMHRLLQGDVGSGKTAVAVYAILSAIAAGWQAAFLAPTEVLAKQHFRTLEHLLQHSRVKRTLLTGSLTSAERKSVLDRIASQDVDLVVGTHALLQDAVKFRKLGMVIVDEQHKFGVRQRAKLLQQTPVPNLLVMTATPIPRSLSMTWFGDLDVSILDEKPPGRKPTLTYVVPDSDRARAYEFLKKQLAAGQKAIIVCPRITSQKNDDPDLFEQKEPTSESDSAAETTISQPIAASDSKQPRSVESVAEELAQLDLPANSFDVLHGKLADAQKDKLIARFRDGRISLLVSTVVIEVGLDIPDCNMILIENAERFGLSQLHQIRGRVGRGGERGVCMVIAGIEDKETMSRLKQFAKIHDGFELAELDAELRGIGQPIGVRQSGFFQPRIGDYLKDMRLLAIAREDAKRILGNDPGLRDPQWRVLRHRIIEQFGNDLELALIG